MLNIEELSKCQSSYWLFYHIVLHISVEQQLLYYIIAFAIILQ